MIQSVGTLYAIQDLFEHLEKHIVSHEHFLEGFSKYGSSTVTDVYSTATELSWICRAENGQLVPTEFGKAANQGKDRPTKLRYQLANIIERTKPTWGGLLPKGRKEAKAGFSDEIKQCFEEALLLGEMTDEIVHWWDRLSGIMREVGQRQLLETGRRGERLTLRYEETRTSRKPSWQSIESNYAGYDVLSVRDQNDNTPLKIEVKASTRPFSRADIHITQNEWITASASLDVYLLHLWLLEPEPMLFIVPSDVVLAHIPADQGKGRWRNVQIPMHAVTHPSKAIKGYAI
jgi:hypothetical protein